MTATAAFRDALGAMPAEAEAATLLGLEHEYRLRRDDEGVDFRRLIHSLPIPGRRLDPGDDHAYRCTSGLAVTCDGAEAEIASPPAALRPFFTREVDAWAHAGHALLASLLPDGVALDGYSTHLSAAVPDERADDVAQRFTRAFAASLMLLLDRPASHGVFVRPRPGRLELCGEYAIGDRLRAATAFFVGAVRACAAGSNLPPALAVNTLTPTGRYGIEVDRRVAFGFDFYRDGRNARLPLAAGGTMLAQVHLEQAWGSARGALTPFAAPADLAECDRVVDGSSPLGIETSADGDRTVWSPPVPTPYGDLLRPRTRPGYRVSAAVATWAYTVFGISGAARAAYACVPRALLDRFLVRLDAGALDPVIIEYLRRPSSGLRLATAAQTQVPGLWDELSISTDLVPAEREPAALEASTKTGRYVGLRVGKPYAASSSRQPPPRRTPNAAAERAEAAADGAAGSPAGAVAPSGPGDWSGAAAGPTAGGTTSVPSDGHDDAGGTDATAAVAGGGPPTDVPDQVRRADRPAVGVEPYLVTEAAPVTESGPVAAAPPPVRRRWPAVLLIAMLLAGALGVAIASQLSGGDHEVATRTATTTPLRSSVTSVATTTPSSTTSSTVATTTSGPTTSAAPLTSTPAPTAAPTTTPTTTVATTVVPAATTTSTTTTTTLPPPLVITVGVGCTFTPTTASRPLGSVVRFRNTTGDSITVTGDGPPGTGDVLFSLDSGGESGPYTLTIAGTYTFDCTGSGSGSMSITVT